MRLRPVISVFRSLLVLVAALALLVPVAAQAQDDDMDELLRLRRAAQQELADVGRRLADVATRVKDPDWVITQAADGSYVQIDLKRVDKLVPWVQMALADQGAAPALLKRVEQYFPGASLITLVPDAMVPSELKPHKEELERLVAGDIEAIDPAQIRAAIRELFKSHDARMGQHYAALTVQLEEQRETLEILLLLLDADIEAREGSPSPAPTTEPSPMSSPDPCEPDGEDALAILCSDWGDEATPEPTLEPTWEPSLPPTEMEELPSPSPEPTSVPTLEPEPSPGPTPPMEGEGIEYDALEGLTHCDADDPDCVDPAPCSEADMWCDETAPELSPAPVLDPPVSTGIVCSDWMSAALEAPYTTLTAGQIGACFDDCQGWMSWHASFGDVLPSSCS